MSNTKSYDTKFAGLYGPKFPEPLAQVQKRFKYHPERLTSQFFDEVAGGLAGDARMYPHLDDGTIALCEIFFAHEDVLCLALLPIPDDLKKQDGTFASFHVAIFFGKEVDEAFIASAADRFAEVFDSVYREMYEKAILESKRKKREGI